MNELYLCFDIGSPARFHALQKFFHALKKEKAIIQSMDDGVLPEEEYEPENEPNWFDLLDEDAIEWFADVFDFDSEEGKTYQQLWNLTDYRIRFDHPMFRHPGNWSLEGMIESLFDKECTYNNLVELSPGKGRLTYTPLAFPFGGSESLVALVESFGQIVTFDSWHEGPHRRRVVGWNYEKAKALVTAGQGVTWENCPID